MSREAMKLALEALEFDGFTPEDSTHRAYQAKAITAIKQALEQEKALQALHDENERLGLYKDAYEHPEPEPVAFYVYKPTLPRGHLGNVSDGGLPWVYDQDPSSGYSARMLVYTSPPKREWQGLTDEEMVALCQNGFGIDPVLDGNLRKYAKAIEAKLKEKNT